MYKKGDNKLAILSLFRGDYKARFYLREISRRTGLLLKTCQNALAILENNNILRSHVEGKNKYFSLNLENIQTKFVLLQAEIYETNLFLETHSQFKLFLKSLATTNPLILFGSFAKGTAKADSDVDLLLVADKELKLPFHLLPHEPHLVTMSEKTFLKAITLQEDLMKEIEEHHILLNNHSFYVDQMWVQYAK